MTTPARSSLSEAVHALRFDSPPGHPSARPSGLNLFREASTLRQPVIDQSWQELSERASRCLGAGYAALRRLQGQAAQAARLDARQRPIAEAFSGLLQFVAKGNQRAEFAHALDEKLTQSDPQARLEALLAKRPAADPALSPVLLARLRAAVTTKPGERIDVDASLERLSRGKTQGVSLLVPFSPRADEGLAPEIDRAARYALLCLCRGLLAGVHAEFNLALSSAARRTGSRATGSTAVDDVRSAFERLVDDAEGRLRHSQRILYGALVAGQALDAVADAAMALAGGIERTLPGFVRIQAAIRLAMLRLRELGKGTASERLGRVGVRAGALTREAIASHCSAYRLAVSVLSPRPASDVAALLADTDVLPFSIPLPNGKDTALGALDARRDGRFVDIEGFVTAVEAQRQGDGKLISHVALLDPSSGATADAVAVFAHLPHAGVTRDAFCRLSGVFRTSSALFQGKPAVETDVLPLAELSKASWQLAFLRLADRWFQPWRNNMNLYWSLGPHGGSDDGEGLFGAGELLFTPLVRP